MCFHIIQSKLSKQIERRFNAKIRQKNLFQPTNHLNGFDFPQTPIITNKNPEIIEHYNWGLIPNWSKFESIRALTLNAKVETIAEKPSFKNVLSQRCLILANGFYEWQWRDSKGKNKVKYQIGLEGDELFAFAGLYSHWINPTTTQAINTFTILTTEANPLMAEIHNIKKRMPIILKPEDEMNWLQQKSIAQFSYPYSVSLIAKNLECNPDELTLF